MGASELPEMNILQMILEGPSSYFGRRGTMADQLFLQNQAQQQSGQFAQGLLQTPQFKSAIANPLDRQKQFDLWAQTQAGPEGIARQGGNWLQTAIGAAYGRESQQFADQLDRSRIVFGNDQALQLEKEKMKLQADQYNQQFSQLFGTDPATGLGNQESQFIRDQSYNAMATRLGLSALPEGMSIGRDPMGAVAVVPTPGGKQWQEMTKGLSPLQAASGAIDELLYLDQSGSSDTGRRQQLIAMIQDQIRTSNNMGSLDAGSMAQMNKYINDYNAVTGYGAVPVGSKNYGIAQEKLRGLKITNDQKILDWSRQYMTDPLKVGDPYKFTPPPEKVKLPEISADDAMKKTQAQPKESSAGAGGLPTYKVPSLLDDDAGARRERAAEQKEALKKKLPGYKYGNR